jgi:cbb3-type cytochrome oxidase subunit 3
MMDDKKIKLIKNLLLLFTIELLIWIPFGLLYNQNYNSSHDFLIPVLSPFTYIFLACILIIYSESNKLVDVNSTVFINSTIPFLIFWGTYIFFSVIIYLIYRRKNKDG